MPDLTHLRALREKARGDRSIYPRTFADLMGLHSTAEIINLLGGNVVRRLTRRGNQVEVDGATDCHSGFATVHFL